MKSLLHILKITILMLMLPQAPGLAAADSDTKQYPTLPFSSDFGGSFELTDHTGKVVTDQDFRGQYVILYFGYTNCADVCPSTLHSIGLALKQVGAIADRITPVFVNLDPERGSLEAMEQYVHYFHPRFTGLMGSEGAIRRAAGSYGIRYRYAKNDDGTTLMVHSGKIFFLGPDGNVLTYFPHEASVDWMATDMKRYVRDGLDQNADDAAALYTKHQCHICHGEQGCHPAQDGYPVIAGQNKAYLIRQILDIRDGVRDNAQAGLMRPLTKLISDDEVEAIAHYLSQQHCKRTFL